MQALSLYLVTDTAMCNQHGGLIHTVCNAIDGGVTMVQLRDKTASDEELYRMVCELQDAIDGRVPLIINDRVNIARRAKLDGAHVGQSDMTIVQARELLGEDAILGLSINTLEELIRVKTDLSDFIDYVGFGPVFATSTKQNHAPPIGMCGLRELVKNCHLPSVAIGGIHTSNAAQVYATGVNGIAVVSAICASDTPAQSAQALTQTRLEKK